MQGGVLDTDSIVEEFASPVWYLRKSKPALGQNPWSYTLPRRNFSAREAEWLQELDGIELASFWQRCCAFILDWVIIGVIFGALADLLAGGVFLYMRVHGHSFADLRHLLTA